MTDREIMELAKQAFEGGVSAPVDMTNLQHALAAWQNRNFGAQPATNLTLGVCEEAGELAHAVLKAEQKIRGMAAHEACRTAVSDALGDLLVYACQVATVFRLDLGTVFRLTAGKVMQRDWVKDSIKGGEE